jgi:predicted Rdx family selenoprotein
MKQEILQSFSDELKKLAKIQEVGQQANFNDKSDNLDWEEDIWKKDNITSNFNKMKPQPMSQTQSLSIPNPSSVLQR